MEDSDLEADLDSLDATVGRLQEELAEVDDAEVRAMVARIVAHVEAARHGLAELEAYLDRCYVPADPS